MAPWAARIDHLVVTTPKLTTGVAWLESILGAHLQPGGEHARMGTHNALLRLGDSTYLEVIAPDPAAVAPRRPRWFELDALDEGSRPRLAAWVARTTDVRASLEACGHAFGSLEAMSRNLFRWTITIPPDGGLLGGGAIPMLIEWAGGEHPASGLEDRGCRLAQLEIFHSDPRSISDLFGCLGLSDEVPVREVEQATTPYLVAQIDTPSGSRTLSGRR